MSYPDLKVVVPTAGRPTLLERTLRSLAACRRPAAFSETIVVGNGLECGSDRVVANAPRELRARYLTSDAETGKYITQSLPCPFLDGNLCSIYEVRPAVCADYPHLHRNFRSRLWQVIDNAETCPIVYNVVERLKKTLGFVDA